jgi:hypothetical protein
VAPHSAGHISSSSIYLAFIMHYIDADKFSTVTVNYKSCQAELVEAGAIQKDIPKNKPALDIHSLVETF